MDKPGNNKRFVRQKTYAAVLQLLDSVTMENKYPDSLLGELFKKEELSPAEKAAIVETLYGILRHRGRIDYIIENTSSAVIPGLQLTILNTLRICAYQAVFTDTQAAGILNNAVALASAYERGRFTGFVKRTVEAVIRNRINVRYPDNPAEYIAVYHSHPLWIVEKWLRELGDIKVVEALCRSDDEEPPLTIRANPLKTDRERLQNSLKKEGFGSRPTTFSPYGLILDIKEDIFKTEAFGNGLFEVQDEGSQLIAMLTGAKPGECVIDACAGNGGKSLFLSGLMKARGTVVAIDTHAGKLSNLRRRAGKSGATNIITMLPDDEEVRQLKGSADCVFIDAPCSGMGVFRRNPDSKWRLTQQDISELAAKQKGIIREYSEFVKPGGRLVYATCTISREENEDVVLGFLEENEGFYIVPADEMDPGIFRELTTEEGFFRSMPHLHNTDGFFGAVMKRRSR